MAHVICNRYIRTLAMLIYNYDQVNRTQICFVHNSVILYNCVT